MNICIVIGDIIENINFKFVLNGKKDSIASFKIKLLNNSVINVITYNEIADYCYRKLKENERILVEGKLNSKLEIEVEKIIIWRDERKNERRKK